MVMDELIRRAATELANSRYAIALTGAGISTESGIPDFRGPKGLWTTDKEAEAKAYQRYELFLKNPKAYWEEMLGIGGKYGEFYQKIREAQPNPGHFALAELEALGILKCVITQNIDGLHQKAGSKRVLEYHGSVHKLRCPACGRRLSWQEVSLENLPPLCPCGSPLKYDVVHFKEPIPGDVMEQAQEEALKCDLMLICGTSAVVYPFAALPRQARRSATRIIEINAEPTPLTHEGVSDYLIRGRTGEILPRIVEQVKAVLGHEVPGRKLEDKV